MKKKSSYHFGHVIVEGKRYYMNCFTYNFIYIYIYLMNINRKKLSRKKKMITYDDPGSVK